MAKKIRNWARVVLASFLMTSAAAMSADDNEIEGLSWAVALRPYCDMFSEGFASRTSAAYAAILKQYPTLATQESPETTYGTDWKSKPQSEQDLQHCARLEQSLVGRGQPPDSRLASPESTWKYLLDSLRKGDRQGVLTCLTADAHADFEKMFREMPIAELRKMADSFTGFHLMEKSLDDYQEVAIVRGDQATIARFVRINGNWKLDQL